MVSIIVPTRDMLHFLKPCVESLLARTTWPNYEILIVDNQSTCTETLAFMEAVGADERVRVLRYDQPFNFSAINNYAAEQSRGDILCLLNNDTEVLTPDWLEEMVSRLLQPGVGVVGARLYFTDGRVQHAGDVLGPGGCASHLHGPIAADDPGYMDRAMLAQDLSAVTAACFVTPRELYRSLGGLEEETLPVAFNDVDYCLRVRESGHRVIYTPYAELYHHESVSRGKDDDPVKAARAKRESDYMRRRWGAVIERDPFYNPNLNYSRADFRLGRLPRIGFPWIE
jgi:GT2 family glycosyltransferase